MPYRFPRWGQANGCRPAGLASLGRVEAEPSPLEGMHFKAAVKVMHAAWRGEDVCVIQEGRGLGHCSFKADNIASRLTVS